MDRRYPGGCCVDVDKRRDTDEYDVKSDRRTPCERRVVDTKVSQGLVYRSWSKGQMMVRGIQSTSWSVGWCHTEANVNSIFPSRAPNSVT